MTLKRFIKHLFSACALLVAAPAALAEVPDPVELLALSDQSRGGGLPGLLWTVDIDNRAAGESVSSMKLLVKAAGNSSIAETLEPVRSRGGKMLQVDRNMWLSKPGLRKPIPISPRQRLSGQAAIGDIAATNYAGDYQATLLREDQHAGEDCHVLELRATSNRTTYDRLNYWVSRDTGLALYAEFLSLSGKVLKTAEFEYANSIQVDQRSVPFVSRMIIRDALTDAVTVLQYSDVRVQRIGASEFAVSGMD